MLDGARYHIPANDHNNALHGGKSGWSVKTWNMTEIDSDEGQAVVLTYVSPDGDEVRPNMVFVWRCALAQQHNSDLAALPSPLPELQVELQNAAAAGLPR